MSMQSVLGVVGGVVGSFFGYPQLGFMVGSLVGGLLTPKEKTEGPRLDDLKVQVSTYGSGIPILYGTERIGGNVVWSTDKIETSTTTEAGKGGGAENKSYRYFVHMRIVLCETPRDGSEVNLVKIFVDGKLQWDASSGMPVASALASEENLFAFFTLYQGHADQLPDPVEEIYAGGPGSVPAYRGVVSISMKAIECPGGRVPQFSFVLSNRSSVEVEKLQIVSTPSDEEAFKPDGGLVYSGSEFIHYRADLFSVGPTRSFRSSIAGSGFITPLGEWTFPSVYTGPSNLIPVVGGDPAFVQLSHVTSADYGSGLVTADRVDAKTGVRAVIATFDPPIETIYGYSWAAYDVETGDMCIVPIAPSPDPNFVVSGNLIPKPPQGYGPTAAHGGFIYMMKSDGSVLTWMDSAGAVIDEISIPMPSLGSSGIVLINANSDGVWILGADQASNTGVIFKVAPATGLVTLLTDDITIPGSSGSSAARYVSFFANDSYAVLGPTIVGSTMQYHMLRFNTVTFTPYRVSEIIADQCERAGENRYDISAIPDEDTLRGYKLQNPASARNNIDSLLTAYAIFIVDEDGLIKFKKYEDITSEATISYDELGQAEDDSEPADAMPLNRVQEIDLPRSVAVSYVEQEFDYQTATEKETRQVTEANEDLIIELPIATDSDHAKKVAQMILFARWRSQNTRSLKVSRKYAFLSPGDGITVEYPRGTFRLWRIMIITDTGALIEMTVEPGDAEIYTQLAVGATGYLGQQVSPIAPSTHMLLLDSPIMRDEDSNAGLYVAAEGYGPGWRGYTLWVGDDDTNLEERGTVTAAVPIGFAESALGDWAPNMLDGQNSVVINMGDDALSSTTEAILMTSRMNLALIGSDGRWEAIQFMIASSLGSGRYLLYGLVRGLYGTERFRGSHQVGDNFVLVQADGMLRPNQSSGELGQTKSYRPVSLGRSLASSASQQFANHGVGLLPYSPWNAGKSKAASNDQTITWERRTRLSSNSLRGIVPLGEATERYSVEFYTSSAFTTLAGTLTSATNYLTITSAQQAAFGLTPGATLYVHIRQLSDVVGAGSPLEATL